MEAGKAVVVFLVLCMVVRVASDVCSFPRSIDLGSGGNVGACVSVARLRACLDAVPFEESYRDNTIAALRQMFNFYSFTDIVKNSGPPYNMQVDIFGELDAISTQTYSSDYAFVSAVQTMFNRLNDAHTVYYAPSPYQWFLMRPFLLHTTSENNELKFEVSGILTAQANGVSRRWEVFNAAAGGPNVNVSAAVGKTIVQINGVPVLDYIQKYADLGGTYKNAGVRLNAAVKGTFYFFSMTYVPLTSDVAATETYSFSDGTSITVELPAWSLGVQFTNLSSLQSLLPNRAGGFTRRTNFDTISEGENRLQQNHLTPVPPHVKMIKRLLAQDEPDVMSSGGSEKRAGSGFDTVLNASMENAVVVSKYTAKSGQGYMVLRLNTFETTNYDLLVQWLLSFQRTVKFAFDYGQANNITNLIVDVTDNLGGFICLSTTTRAAMFPIYSGAIHSRGAGLAQGQFDYRIAGEVNSTYSNLLRLFSGNTDICNTTGITDESWFFPTSTHTRGGVSSLYTDLWAFSCNYSAGYPFYYNDPNGLNWTPSFYFSKVVVVTDGTCGSACSQFVSKLQADSTAVILSYGGRLDTELDTSSFHGGDVQIWSRFVAGVNYANVTPGFTLKDLPTSASASFNFAEGYQPGAVLPREFESLPGYDRLSVWPARTNSYKLAVYEAATSYFSQISNVPTSSEGTCRSAIPGDTVDSNPSSSGRTGSFLILVLSSLFNLV